MNISSDLFWFAFWKDNYLTGFTRNFDEALYYLINSIFKKIEETLLDIERYITDKFGKKISNSYYLKDFNLSLKENSKFNKLSYIKINLYLWKSITENNNHYKPKEKIAIKDIKNL
jgi:hypothetical protein